MPIVSVATDRVGRFHLSIEKEIREEVGINNPISKLERDEFDVDPNQNCCILTSYGLFNTSFMIVSLVCFWSSVVYSYATCKIPLNLASTSANTSSPQSAVPFLQECSIYTAEVPLCTIALIVCFIAHLLSFFVRVPYIWSYRRNLLLGSDNNYELLEILQIYLLKGETCGHMAIKFLKIYTFTQLLSILLNFGTLFNFLVTLSESGVWRLNAPDLFCWLLGWSFILVYVDFNANTVMLRDMLLKGTHITGFTGGKEGQF